MRLLSAESLAIEVAGRTLCQDLNIGLDSGQRWGLIGANGIGKTMLLCHLAGLLPVANGEIRVYDIPVRAWQRKLLARELGMLFQDNFDVFPVTVMEAVLAGRYPYIPFWSLEGRDDLELARSALADVGLQGFERRQVDTLSGGERRRLAIATLLLQSPRIWLLDEPGNHLDPHFQVNLLDLIFTRTAAVDGALLMVLHDVNLLSRYCTHAMLMLPGPAFLQGPVSDVITRENLELLYRHPIREIASESQNYYFPY